MPLTQLACDVSQLHVERETVHLVFSYAAAVSKCYTWLPTHLLAKSRYVVHRSFSYAKGDSGDSSRDSPLLSKLDISEISFLEKVGMMLVQAALSLQDGTVSSTNVCRGHGDAQNPTGTCITHMESVPRCPSIVLPTHPPLDRTLYSS